ncbi:MAG: hypothetical protein PHX21_07690 [bacterium]|nr:hypothetical protein [bacterium]
MDRNYKNVFIKSFTVVLLMSLVMFISSGCVKESNEKEKKQTETYLKACMIENELFIKLPLELTRLLGKREWFNKKLFMIIAEDTTCFPECSMRIKCPCAICFYDMATKKMYQIGTDKCGEKDKYFTQALKLFGDERDCISDYLGIRLTTDLTEKLKVEKLLILFSGDDKKWEVMVSPIISEAED